MIAFIIAPLTTLVLTQAGRFLTNLGFGIKIAEGQIIKRANRRARKLNLPAGEIEDAEEEVTRLVKTKNPKALEYQLKLLKLSSFGSVQVKNLHPLLKNWEGDYLLTEDEMISFWNSLAYVSCRQGVGEESEVLDFLSQKSGLRPDQIAVRFMTGCSVDPRYLQKVSQARREDSEIRKAMKAAAKERQRDRNKREPSRS